MQQIPIGIDVKVQRIAPTTAALAGAIAIQRAHVLTYMYACAYSIRKFASEVHTVAQRNGEGATWCHVPPALQQTMQRKSLRCSNVTLPL